MSHITPLVLFLIEVLIHLLKAVRQTLSEEVPHYLVLKSFYGSQEFYGLLLYEELEDGFSKLNNIRFDADSWHVSLELISA